MSNNMQEQTKQSPPKQQVQQQLQQQAQSRQQAQSQPMSDQPGSVRELAYRLWEEAGCPEGEPERFWLEAEDRINRSKINRT